MKINSYILLNSYVEFLSFGWCTTTLLCFYTGPSLECPKHLIVVEYDQILKLEQFHPELPLAYVRATPIISKCKSQPTLIFSLTWFVEMTVSITCSNGTYRL